MDPLRQLLVTEWPAEEGAEVLVGLQSVCVVWIHLVHDEVREEDDENRVHADGNHHTFGEF